VNVNRLRSMGFRFAQKLEVMKILEFNTHFPSEESCKQKFIEYRLKQGIRCKKCKGTDHYWKRKREQWECKKCAYRTTVKSGTVMENSKLPFKYWFVAMHLMTSTKKSFSAKAIQNELNHNRYQPIWEMMHKIRSVMGLRDNEYTLKDKIELDEGFFETVSPKATQDENQKRGRGSQKQTMVMVMTESKEVNDEEDLKKKYNCNKRLRFIKMKVAKGGFKSEIFTQKVSQYVDKQTTIVADGSTSYTGLKKDFDLQSQATTPKEASKMLPWVHTTIANAKRLLLDVHHRIDSDFLENYLNEFVFKLNRRYFENIFDRVLVAAVSYKWNYLGETYG
jgi:hypothetical protein